MSHSQKNNLSPKEVRLFKKLLRKTPALPNIPEEVFVPLMRKNVPAVVDLAIIRNHKVLLTHRKDYYYTGWHFPGSLIRPGETFERAASRILSEEVGLRYKKIKMLKVFNCPTDKRFHYLSLFFLCQVTGKPTNGTWFLQCPSDIIPEQKKLWSIIKPYFKEIIFKH